MRVAGSGKNREQSGTLWHLADHKKQQRPRRSHFTFEEPPAPIARTNPHTLFGLGRWDSSPLMYLCVLGNCSSPSAYVCARACVCVLRARGVTGSGPETWRGVSSEDSFHSRVSFSPPCGPVASSLNHQQKIKVIIATNPPTGLRNPWVDL